MVKKVSPDDHLSFVGRDSFRAFSETNPAKPLSWKMASGGTNCGGVGLILDDVSLPGAFSSER